MNTKIPLRKVLCIRNSRVPQAFAGHLQKFREVQEPFFKRVPAGNQGQRPWLKLINIAGLGGFVDAFQDLGDDVCLFGLD